MKIAIIGTGNVGAVLGRRWSEAGHDVVFGSRHPSDMDVQDLARRAAADISDPRSAAEQADVVVLAVPGTAVDEVAEALGSLSGRIIIDCTNPIGSDLTFPSGSRSAAERIAEMAPGARVVKAFNTTGSKNMADPVYSGGRLVMPLCGDDGDAKAVVSDLARTLGFEPMDNGPLKQARALEGMAFMWISQAYTQGWGSDFGFAALKR